MDCSTEGKSYNPHLEIIILKIISVGRGLFYAKNFTYMDLFNPHNNSMKEILLLNPFSS